MVTAAPVSPKINRENGEMDLDERNTTVQKWRTEADWGDGNLLGKAAEPRCKTRAPCCQSTRVAALALEVAERC